MGLSDKFKAWLKPVGYGTVVLIVAAVSYFLFCYFRTPKDVILIHVNEFPADLKPGFTPGDAETELAADLRKILAPQSRSSEPAPCQGAGGRGPTTVSSPTGTVPIPLPSGPTPLFDKEYKGLSLNLLRGYAMSARAKRFIEVRMIGTSASNIQLLAYWKEKPSLAPQALGIEQGQGVACSEFGPCIQTLAESVLASPQLGALAGLLAYYETLATDARGRGIVRLYESGAVPMQGHQSEHFTRWGNGYLDLGNYDQALEKYQAALAADPQYCPALIQRGYLFLVNPNPKHVFNDLELAKNDLNAAAQCSPKDPAVETNLSFVYFREWAESLSHSRSLLVQAKSHAEKALELAPQCVQANVNLAFIIYRQGDRTAALAKFEKLEQTYPRSYDVLVNYGFMEYLEYLRTGDLETMHDAIRESQKAHDIMPGDAVLASNLGYFYYEVDDLGQAEGAFRSAIAVDSRSADALAGLALVTFKHGNPRKAEDFLQQAVTSDFHYADPDYVVTNPLTSKKVAQDYRAMIEQLKKQPAR